MARKQAIQNDARVKEAVEEFKVITEVRYEIAKEAFDFQDEGTQKIIDRIVSRLRLGAKAYIDVHVNPPAGSVVAAKIEQKYVDFNLLYIATEILKDSAMIDVRVGTYKFPPSLCVQCGAEIVGEKPKKRRRA